MGDASKAERELGWKATVLTPDLARLMTEAEVSALPSGRLERMKFPGRVPLLFAVTYPP